MEHGHSKARDKVDIYVKRTGQIDEPIALDVVCIAFVSLAMMPMLLKNVFEEQMERPMDDQFLEMLASFNGQLFTAGMAIELLGSAIEPQE